MDEAVFWFMNDNDDVYNEYCNACIYEDISMCEWVLDRCSSRFYDYCISKGWDYNEIIEEY